MRKYLNVKSKLLTLFLLLAGAARFAGGDDVVAVPAPLPGGDFEADLDAWPLTKEYAIGPWGRNGTNGMKVERQSGYDFMGRPIQLKPGSSYRLGWWLKTDGKLPGGGAAVSVDWYSGGAWVSFTMLDIVADTGGEWRHYSGEFTAPSDPGFTYALLAYLRHDTAGRAWFDDFVLEELVGEAAVYPVNASTGRIVAGTPLDVVVYVTGGGAVPELTYEIVSGGAAAARGTVPVAAERAEIPTAGLLPGDYRLRLTPRQAGRDFAVREYPLTVAAEAVGRVRIDELGRCLVDGEPFMPVGWFISSVAREGRGHGSDCDLSRMAASPFNTVMPYNGLRLPDSTLEDPVAGGGGARERGAPPPPRGGF